MSATRSRLQRHGHERGSTMVTTVILMVALASLSLLLVASAQASHKEVSARLDATKAFYVAEGGLDFVVSQIAIEQFWPVESTLRFPTVNNSTELESDWITLGTDGGQFKAYVVYEEDDGTDLDVSDRAAEPLYNQIELRVVGRSGQAQRSVRALIQFEVTTYDSAIVSDSPTIGFPAGSNKGLAKDHANVVFKTAGPQYVYGGIRANGGIYADDTANMLTNDNKDTLLDAFTGDVMTEAMGTDEEIPDFTDPGSPEQLFEFARFEAVAAAGRGAVYDGLAAFAAGANAANLAGVPMEGVIYVKIDAAVEGNDPHIKAAGGDVDIPGGITVLGSLVFDFSNTGDDFYKVFLEVPLNVNAAVLPADFDPADPTTFTTGYPPTISALKDPRGFAMNDPIYEDFPLNADLPAIMFNTGTVDIHGPTNVCGAIYGPSFIEIENKGPSLQYFNGIIVGGAGVYLEGKTGGAGDAQVFVYDHATVNALPTYRNRAKVPVRTAYLIDE